MDRREEDIISSRLIQSSWVETVQSFDPGSFRPESLRGTNEGWILGR